MRQHKRVLVLNADFQSLSVVDWTNAMSWLVSGEHQMEIIDFYKNDFIEDSAGRKHPVPAVMRCSQYIKPRKKIPFSRKNIFIRDNCTCQYCGKQFPIIDLEYDHVHPRSKWDNKTQGTPTKWENIVTCCRRCNRVKADKTLKECGFKLLKQPKQPSSQNYVRGISPWSFIEPEWIPYLPKNYTNYKN